MKLIFRDEAGAPNSNMTWVQLYAPSHQALEDCTEPLDTSKTDAMFAFHEVTRRPGKLPHLIHVAGGRSGCGQGWFVIAGISDAGATRWAIKYLDNSIALQRAAYEKEKAERGE